MSTAARPAGRPNRAAWATILVGGVVGVVLSWAVARHSLIGARWHLVILMALWVPVWLITARAALALPGRLALGAVIVVAVALRLAAVAGTPSISNDLYRYAWDAHVQLSGLDPYRYPPDSPAVARLRTAGFWPGPARCGRLRQRPGCTVLNRPDVRTVYPAVAQAWFVAVHVLTPGDAGSRPWQLAGGAVDLATVGLIVVGLGEMGRDRRAVAWYALSPLPVVEFAGNGHVDGLALLLLVAAVLAVRRQRRALAGVLVGAATMVKIYPALAVVALWRRGRWRLVLAGAATVVLTEAPHVLVVGTKVLGYLPGYFKEEHYGSGTRFLLLGLTGLPAPVQDVAGAAILGLVIFAVWRNRMEPAWGMSVLFGTLLLIVTPVQPWYAVTLAGLGCLAGAPWWALVALAGEPYYATVILDDPHQVAVGRLSYGLAALGVLTMLWWRQRSAAPAVVRP